MNEREPRGARARGWEIGRENRGSNELKKNLNPKERVEQESEILIHVQNDDLNPRAKWHECE